MVGRRLVGAIVLALHVLAAGPSTAGAGDGDANAHDPIEGVNRGVFRFNDTLDRWAFEPVARGWHWAIPDPAEQSIEHFFGNLRFPVVLANNLLQGKVEGGAVTLGRFLVNSTVGIGGLFDPASDLGLASHPEDFGQTLGWWGTPPGPYLMLPLLGPSSVRDTGGLVVDYCLSVVPFVVSGWATVGAGIVRSVNGRAQILDEVESAREAALDYYVFVRDAYTQHRHALVHDELGDDEAPPEDDLYDAFWPADEGGGDDDAVE